MQEIQAKQILCLRMGKLWLDFPVENRAFQLTTCFESSFPGGLFWHSTNEKYRGRPLRLPGNANLVSSKVGVTQTYANKNKEQHRGFAGRISFQRIVQ